jgi:hypothetical protein
MYSDLLNGAYDIHVHGSPDLILRSNDPLLLLNEARQAKMAGILLKDHTTSTVRRVYVLNQQEHSDFKFFSSLCLNPPVGDLNLSAVESSIREGVNVVFFPTYGSRHHISLWGAGKPPTAFPFSTPSPSGVSILNPDGSLKVECCKILRLIADNNTVLATGHISPEESLKLIRKASQLGCKKMVVTHASESVTQMSPSQQREAVKMGAYIEHCFFAVTPTCPNPISLEEIRDQIRYVGVEHAILSSDFGQIHNPPPVEGFGLYLEKMRQVGFSKDEIRQMTRETPKMILVPYS